MFAPIAPAPLDPYSEEYHQKLIDALQLDSDKYHHVPPHILSGFKDLLRKYPTAFLLPGAQLGQVKGFEHIIDTGDLSPLYHPPYRKSPAELRNIHNEIQRMLELKIIQPSHQTEHGLPQSPRFCVDYCSLNQVTKGDNYPIPSVANILDAISCGKIYRKFDLASGYWQVNLRQQDRHKTAFTTHIGLFEFLGLPFGLKTAPNTFQRILNTVFSQFLYKWLIIYVGDCVTWSNSYADALEYYQLLLETATKV